MKKRTFNAVLSLLMVVSLILGQPAMVNAEEMTDVTVTEDGSSITTAETPVDEESETETGIDDEVNTETGDSDETEETSQIPDEGNSDEMTNDENNSDTDNNGGDDRQTEDEESQIPDEGEESSDTETNVDDKTDEADVVDGSQISGLSVEKRKTLNELGFTTMSLTTRMKAEKEDLDVVAQSVKAMKADKDYVENEIVYIADSEAEAKEIAECYGGTLLSYDDGLASASIEQKVYDAVRIASDTEISIPAVYPNVIYSIEPTWSGSEDSSVDTASKGAVEKAEKEEVAKEEVAKEEDADELVFMDVEDVEDEEAYVVESDEENPFSYVNTIEPYAVAPSDPGYLQQWHHNTVNTVEAWDAAKGAGVTVAVLDSGVDYNHPDLNIGDLNHISTYDDDGYDDNGHGTHCAGIIAALQNGLNGVGIAPEATIYSVKILDAQGEGTTVTAVQGMRSAISKNVDVMSMSFGSFCYDALFQKEITAAAGKGIVMIAAAGNEATSQKVYPAAYDNVVAVAATDRYDEITEFSNYGSWVDIAAPGDNIYSTLPNRAFGNESGTSMACPIVAATVALMLSNNSTLKGMDSKAGAAKIIKTLIDSADPYGAYDPWFDNYYPLVDVEATTYAVDASIPAMPTIKFSGGEPTSKNVVLAGPDPNSTDPNPNNRFYYFELDTTTEHGKIYFTVNGKKPTAKNGIRFYKGGRVNMKASGKVKIQAVTVVGNKTSKVFSKTYTFDVKATGLSSPYSTIRDEITVAIGKSIQLDVNISPSYVSNKKLEWSSGDATGMIKVNKSGKVSCNKKATAGLTTTIKAKTTDGSEKEYEFKVTAVNEKVEFLNLNAENLNMSAWTTEMTNDGHTMLAPNGTPYSSTFQLEVSNPGVSTKQYLYKSSNANVATVSSTGRITARAKGKAKITVTANDGSGKKAVCNVTVVTPVFAISATSSTGYVGGEVLDNGNISAIPIGTGCSITMKTAVNYNSKNKLYVPNDKRLDWTSENPGKVSVKNGKVTCDKNATPGDTVWITVTAKDGWGTNLTIPFVIVDKVEKLYYETNGKQLTSAAANLKVGEFILDPLTEDANLKMTTMHNTRLSYNYFTVSTSNRDVVYRYDEYLENTITGRLEKHKIIMATKPGSSKVTYTARDGSNKKFTINFKVTARTLTGL
ncbi:MAG: S8 family serine peptidase [Lachnospiraceae bacterium]|nr:S8 family serine peptidase [Lachnospiraceae bacterium]